ncbi:hypothetical protein CEP52_005034 [Fusarium oligoseptatum]|uniref:Uncharacterized protein n=1 Tax=Fusarium oligoseptatum TaxID=2604345 RepID=A0A428U0F7_9HYPO|nr:hypothetical protein CEP52_005034 [Fusarium oligoseptatum]
MSSAQGAAASVDCPLLLLLLLSPLLQFDLGLEDPEYGICQTRRGAITMIHWSICLPQNAAASIALPAAAIIIAAFAATETHCSISSAHEVAASAASPAAAAARPGPEGPGRNNPRPYGPFDRAI